MSTIDQDQHPTRVSFQTGETGLSLHLSGKLTVDTLAYYWNTCIPRLQAAPDAKLVIDVSGITECSASGVSFLHSLQRAFPGVSHLQGLKPEYHTILTYFSEAERSKKPSVKVHHNFAEGLGYASVDLWWHIVTNIAFLGEMSTQLVRHLRHPKLIRIKDTWKVIEQTGPNALPIVGLLGFLVGLILSFQSAIPLAKFGAKLFVVSLVGIGMTRELGPLMVAVILAGRTASSFAAEIGTMKINQEIDVLLTLGLTPSAFLGIPRIIGVALMAPLLNVFMLFFSFIGCAIFMKSIGYSLHIFMNQLNSAVTQSYFWQGECKAFIFGILIAAIGCLQGFKTQFGASSVGQSTTQAVVTSIIVVVFADVLFGLAFYSVGV